MNTNLLKRFATEARTNLMDGVRLKLRMLGFDERGHAAKAPELISGGTIWRGEEYPEEFYAQWMALRELLLKRGVREVVETAAYTWFNRMVAIRILTRNNLCDSILDKDEMTGMPRLLAEARMGRVPEMQPQLRRRYEWLMDDDMRTTDQFAVLLTAWCHANPIINSCFGSIDGFVEILLPDNILKDGGFLSLLNHTEFITDEDFHSAELIGWLYQFYISDRKDEVFAKKGKVEADEIPAATQIFTPNWIVKYMVQNTIGAIALSNKEEGRSNIGEAAKEMGWEYFVTSKKEEGRSNSGDGSDITYSLSPITCHFESLEALKVADFACGSGHILNECFDLLYDLYMAEAYSRREAIECIFTKNLLGIDIDLRAKQLATFALLLKACQKDPAFADARCMPRVLTVPEMPRIAEDPNGLLPHFFKGDYYGELNEDWETLKDADSLGSIIKFHIDAETRRKIERQTEFWKNEYEVPYGIQVGLPIMDFILALTDSYDAIVMNPPYMPTSRVDALKDYAVKNYPDSKTDLFSVFMDVCIDRLKDGGKYGMINMQSWMFLSSFEALRKKIIEEQHIDSLLHLGPRTFDELSGEVVQNAAFVIAKEKPQSAGIYYRLIDGKSCSAKQEIFLAGDNRYTVANQKQFEQIPGAPIAYWISSSFISLFALDKFKKYFLTAHGILTGHDEDMLRFWTDIDFRRIGFNFKSENQFQSSIYKYAPLAKGGTYRKWYGNHDLLIKYDCNTVESMRRFPKFTLQGHDLYFKEGATWSFELYGDNLSLRYLPQGFLIHHRGPGIYGNSEISAFQVMGFLLSKVAGYFLRVLNPTISCSAGVVNKIPVVSPKSWNSDIPKTNVLIAKQDWDAHETSWDFEENELVAITKGKYDYEEVTFIEELKKGLGDDYEVRGFEKAAPTIQNAIWSYEAHWAQQLYKLQENEELLNRQFIELYGLQDELSPKVPLEEVTILQQGEISIRKADAESNKEEGISNATGARDITYYSSLITWHDDVVIMQLISYIVGVWMGRYRLDKPGLHIAHPNPTEDELAEYQFSITSDQTLKIDSDAIIPVLPKDAPFFDNLYNYVVDFVRKVWGDESLAENINFIEKCLGKSLDDYLMKDFWKQHKKMYQNRPIYWEFASKKGAFRAIVYAHRMDRFTVEVLRSKYLLPYIGHIERKIAALEIRQNELTTAERRELDTLRTKTLPELEEYHKRVEKVAAETAARSTVFDLDDGIIRNHALFGDIVTKLK